jgi:hypothetical protein
VQGVIKSYDPSTGDGVVVRDTDLSEYDLAPTHWRARSSGCCARGNVSCSTSTTTGRASRLRLGSEADMGTPGQ